MNQVTGVSPEIIWNHADLTINFPSRP